MEDLHGIASIDRALREGAAQVASLEATYPLDTMVDPQTQALTYAVATSSDMDDGFAGCGWPAEVAVRDDTPPPLAGKDRRERSARSRGRRSCGFPAIGKPSPRAVKRTLYAEAVELRVRRTQVVDGQGSRLDPATRHRQTLVSRVGVALDLDRDEAERGVREVAADRRGLVRATHALSTRSPALMTRCAPATGPGTTRCRAMPG
ncbi:hypothetical protein [Lentzea sp. NEAU-D7]|uniref:hypothetical protein n=1 Tax=Lentzea sp. NEAU-D7 TaxID=2994667 RepID=UPI00224AD684|nr:hypothetical protein [Lentzea sp. NEAU-D7]MCX2948808.1 hypothetical protein [Lentzea sp. NEAU-D7]